MLGGGALAASGASQLGAPLWLSVVIFAVVSAALVLTVRPVLRKKMAKPDKSAELESRPELLAGRPAEVIEPVSSSAGLIKVNGELWSARSLLTAQTFDAKERVTIVEISGNTAIVDKLL
nr:NfeD family protein [Corynebacterium sp. LK24]